SASTTPSRSPTLRLRGRMRPVMPASARLRTFMSSDARLDRPTKLASSIRAVRSLIGLLQTQAPICYSGGRHRRRRLIFSWSSALHGQAAQVLLLELVAEGRGVVASAEADETGAVEGLPVLFEPLHIGAEVTQLADLAGGVREHRTGAAFGWAGADLHHPATGLDGGVSGLHAARGQKVDRLIGRRLRADIGWRLDAERGGGHRLA